MTRIEAENPGGFRQRAGAITGAGLAAALAACALFEAEPRVCTEIGCSSGLTVELAAAAGGPFKVEVLPLPGGNPIDGEHVYECPGGPTCTQEVFFAGMVATDFMVRVTTTTGVRTTSFHDIEYATVRPNGPGCDPECQQARVVALLPG